MQKCFGKCPLASSKGRTVFLLKPPLRSGSGPDLDTDGLCKHTSRSACLPAEYAFGAAAKFPNSLLADAWNSTVLIADLCQLQTRDNHPSLTTKVKRWSGSPFLETPRAWKSGDLAPRSASPPRVPATGAPGARQGPGSAGHPRTRQVPHSLPAEPRHPALLSWFPARRRPRALPPATWLTVGRSYDVSELQLSSPGFRRENKGAQHRRGSLTAPGTQQSLGNWRP